MTGLDRRALAAVAGAVALLAGGGGAALASSSGDNSSTRCDQRLTRIAERRGVSVDQLKADLEARVLARIDAAETSGRISPERADALRQRIADGGLCGARLVRPRIAIRGMLRAAAGFLGLDRQELREQLPSTSLAALAAKQGKSEAALEAAMLVPAKERLAKAVAAGTIPQARADMILDRLERLAERLATRVFAA
jgi:hypothetical protein